VDATLQVIDTRMGGIWEGTACFLAGGRETALIDSGPSASVDATLAALEDADIEHLDWIVVTHVHLDHAGAVGHLAEHYPMARVAAPERVCRHLVNPARLYAGTRAVWGDRTDTLLGMPKAVAADRMTALNDGDVVGSGGSELLAIATPGHTRHHLAYLHRSSGALICGDALGIRLPDSPLARPGTPPADFSLRESQSSIAKIRRLRPDQLLLGHYGSATDRGGADSVEGACDVAAEALTFWGELMSKELVVGGEDVAERVERRLRLRVGAENRPAWQRLEEVNPTWLNVRGFEADLDRRASPDSV
jgi:glyoxylase-like metal-dependent hydrolase (beta-lactamase superfamily II)